MSLQVNAVNSWTIRVTGMDLDAMGKGDWRALLDDLGLIVQEFIAGRWSEGQTGTGRSLRGNTRQWTMYKASRGWSTERGVRKGKLLGAIEGPRLFLVGPVSSYGSAEIVYLEERLVQRVREHGEAYVPFYVWAKVPFIKRVLQFNDNSLRQAAARWQTDANAMVLRQLADRKRVRE